MRLRWLRVIAENADARLIAERMRQLTTGGKANFALEEVNRSRIAGNFAEVMEWEDTISVPGRGDISLPRIEVRRTEFVWDFRNEWLELADPPRAILGFRQALVECAGSLSLRVPDVEIKRWAATVESTLGPLSIVKILTGPASLSASTHASHLIQGSSDVRSQLSKIPGGRKVGWSKIEANVGADLRFELSQGAKATMRAESAKLRLALRAGLSAVAS